MYLFPRSWLAGEVFKLWNTYILQQKAENGEPFMKYDNFNFNYSINGF